MWNLGAFFGNVARGIRTPIKGEAAAGGKQVVRKDVQERKVDTPQGQVILRRTTIDEVERPGR